MPSLRELKERSCWLSSHARNVTSQHGEDGILEKALELLPARDSWCVEFGAWDGKYLSTTWNLINNHGYHGVLIEGSPSKFKDLLKTSSANPRITPINRMVGFAGEDSLDAILATTPIPREFDFLCIDVDGNDYHIWNSLKSYRPKLVCIEINPSIPNEVDFVQPLDFTIAQGSSIRSMAQLGAEKGYEIIATTRSNALFVDRRYFSLFHIPDNSVEVMRNDLFRVTHTFVGFDGTVFFRGHCLLPWHGVPFDEKRQQLLPSFLRKSPYDYTRFEKFCHRVFCSLRARRLL